MLATLLCTVKPVLSGPSKIDKTKVLMANGSLMKVESIAECTPWSILQHTGTPLECGTWAPQFSHSVTSGHDRYNAIPHGTSMFFRNAETFPRS